MTAGYREEFTLFESGHVRPLALSPDGRKLFALNTPDNRLEIFDVTAAGLAHLVSVPVGLEPVAVAARSNTEVWVVNHLSDSVSVVAVNGRDSRVIRTLLVGDEPRDVVFAGPGRTRAFVTTAHRGQNVPYDPQFTTPGVGRADVWVFDADRLGNGLGGTPLGILNLFTDTPRALAVSPDGARVYAAGFHTGNQTTSASAPSIPPPTYPPPLTNAELLPHQPFLHLIIKWNGQHWVDELGINRDTSVQFSLPDKDVFVIDALADPPVLVGGSGGFFAHVGTVLFNMAVNPVSGRIYVSNTEANNANRFEGPGAFAGHSIRGHVVENRITVLEPGAVRPRHLNKHIDYGSCCEPIPNSVNSRSLALPMDMAVTRDGARLYVAAFGSSKVGVFATAELENDSFVPDTRNHIRVSGGGPSGLLLDEARNRLYVFTRFNNSIAIVDTMRGAQVGEVRLFNPEPAYVVAGRPLLYDAALSSSHGDSACASCHVFGDLDSLAWDLGNPDAPQSANPNPFANPIRQIPNFHPIKGPMATQSLRGLANHGPMHWRADKTGAFSAPNIQPDWGAFDERAAFRQFQPAFPNLLGRSAPLTEAQMEAFADFVLELTYPPNPIRRLDNALTAAQQRGRDKFFRDASFAPDTLTCNACHVLDREGNANFGVKKPGFFGSDGRSSDIMTPQVVKNAQLRNMYQKIGMFGMPPDPLVNPGNNGFTGEQIRGFGFTHGGHVDTMVRFLNGLAFNQGPVSPGGFPPGPEGEAQRRDMEAFMLVFDSNLAPIVGQQVTLGSGSDAASSSRIDLLMARAELGECDLVVRGSASQGYLFIGASHFVSNRSNSAPVNRDALQTLAKTAALTFTCTPPGSGRRIALDRDLDGVLDGDPGSAP